jgi:uroporphyrinogen decarboxylase
MNNYDAVRKAIDFDSPDFLPIWDNYWGEFPQKWRKHMNFEGDVDPGDYYNIAISIKLGDETFFPSDKGLIEKDAEFEIINDGWGRIVKTSRTSYFSETIKRVLEEPGDLDKLTFEHPSLDLRYNGFADSVEKEKAKGRFVFAKTGGIYCRSQFMRGEDLLLMDMAVDETFCHELFDCVSEHLTGMALETLKRGDLWDNGLFVYDDMANNFSTMFSPAMFEKYLLPLYEKMIAILKAAGCRRVCFHSDGNILPVMDMLMEAGFDGFNPLEPRVGIDFVKLREKYGKKVVFFGGVCNTVILPRGDKKEIERHIMPLIELGREGGLVIGQASVGDDIKPEAYDYYASLVRKHGRYSG